MRKPANENTVDPDKLLKLALKEKVKEIKLYPLIEYAKAAEVLRRKGWTWGMVHEWFTEKGIVATSKGLQTANRRWGQTEDYVTWMATVEDKEKELDL